MQENLIERLKDLYIAHQNDELNDIRDRGRRYFLEGKTFISNT